MAFNRTSYRRMFPIGTYERSISMGPLNIGLCAYGDEMPGHNPLDLMQVTTFWSSMRGLISIPAMSIVLGSSICRSATNLWGAERAQDYGWQIQGVVRFCKEFGRKVTTAQDHEGGTWYNTVDEKLQINGMPPNPSDFYPGFVTWPTDGKIKLPVIGGSRPIAACMIALAPVRACKTCWEQRNISRRYSNSHQPRMWRASSESDAKPAFELA